MFGLADRDSWYLFSSRHLSDVLDERLVSVRSEVSVIDWNRLLNTSPEDLVSYLVEKYKVTPPSFSPLPEDWTMEAREAAVLYYDTFNPHGVKVPWQRITVEIPLSGETELMYAQPSRGTLSPPSASVNGNALSITFEVPHGMQTDVKKELDATVSFIGDYLSWMAADLSGFDDRLASAARAAVSARRERLLANQGRAASLWIPFKSRWGAASTYAIPDVRMKVVPKLPDAPVTPYVPEPVMTDEHYEHVLRVSQNMSMVMERSPSAFASADEETVRDHFLVQLNGHFEWRATGETFNGGGKTDILLRESGKNAFIAECKFWKGPKKYSETVDQLLGYSTWRDAKTAIFVFNRWTDLTTVLTWLDAATRVHPNFKRAVPWRHETWFRYVFGHPSDANRELTVTVLVFNVPEPAREEWTGA